VDVERHSLLTTVVGRGSTGEATGAGRSTGAERGLNGLGELISGETGTEDGDVALGERFLGEALDVGSGDGRVRGGEERVAETASEGSRVGEVEGEGGRGCEGREGLGLDGGENQLGVLVGVKVSRGEDGREDVEEVGPAGSAIAGLLVTADSLVASEELGGEEEVLPGEGRGEDTAVQLGLARGFQSGSSIRGLW
jgi:hypothetical protein